MNKVVFVSAGKVIESLEDVNKVVAYSNGQVKVNYVDNGQNRIVESNIKFIYYRESDSDEV